MIPGPEEQTHPEHPVYQQNSFILVDAGQEHPRNLSGIPVVDWAVNCGLLVHDGSIKRLAHANIVADFENLLPCGRVI